MWQAHVGADISVLDWGVPPPHRADNFTGGMALSAFVAYLGSLFNRVSPPRNSSFFHRWHH